MTKLYNIKILQIIIILLLAVAFLLEGFFHLTPCSLCLTQRLLWLVTLLLTITIANKYLLYLSVIANLFIAGYQVLMQYKVINTSCPIRFDDLSPPCSTIDFSVFGISLAGYSLLLCIFALLYIYKIYKK